MSYGNPPPQQPGQPQQNPQWSQQQYPPQPGPGWGTPMSPPKKTNKAGLVAVLGCSGVLVLAVIGGVVALASSGGDGPSSSAGKASSSPSVAASEKAPAKEKPAAEPKGDAGDVTITGCVVNGVTSWPAADVEIVNHSGEKSNYIVSVEFLDKAGTRLGEGMAAANNVAPGQKVRAKAQGLAETSGKVSCKVSDVTRYPSG
ncbi:FxLYD domain-containing protein [Streptomyces sp. BE230]|uniref:FxLYD domain-containing protein n=1 Tax=Streptomyces sp. BE230 TaxID=3002526 RepID=UPI002ED58342|nr:FxLYD domain-containing protein [Streptomyces sp. BE230]